jgi:nitroimidazol reductase NimA-like FMN-containing flavoprotein (pyridoxamine 5'-phosphate oxidase superfamily)
MTPEFAACLRLLVGPGEEGNWLDSDLQLGETMNLTERTQLRRLPNRGSHETATIHEIFDSAFLAHVGFNVNGQPFVVPTLYGRDGDKLYLHGSAASRILRQLETGVPACVTVSLVDGLVLARSAFHHSMNYRSVMAFGTARKINDSAVKINALRVIAEHVMEGRWVDVRGPNEKELKATAVLEFAIEEASAKIRTGPPLDDEEDYELSVWAGVSPLGLSPGRPVEDPRLKAGIEIPEYVRLYGV